MIIKYKHFTNKFTNQISGSGAKLNQFQLTTLALTIIIVTEFYNDPF